MLSDVLLSLMSLCHDTVSFLLIIVKNTNAFLIISQQMRSILQDHFSGRIFFPRYVLFIMIDYLPR